MPDPRDDALDYYWRPQGALPDWVNAIVIAACVTSVAIAVIGAQLLFWRSSGHTPLDVFWVRNGLAVGLASWIALTFAPRWRLARLLRVAVLLPLAHLICMAVGWQLWCLLAPQLPRIEVVSSLPLAALLVGGGAVLALASQLVVRRRRAGESAHALAMMALLALLLLGLWLPIASALWSAGMSAENQWVGLSAALREPAALATFVLVPPLVVAILLTALALRRPDAMRRHRRALVVAGALGFVVALLTRVEPSYGAELIYANFIHALLAFGMLAITAVSRLGVATWHQTRRARRGLATACAGDILSDDLEALGCIEITSWLRGPRRLLKSFAVVTARGHVLVPSGAELVASIPPQTTRLRSGESVEVLRRGDRVVLGGFIEPDARHPFRESSALVPGPTGVFVSRANDHAYGFGDVALAMWRPCVAYLMILTTIAIPALVAALSR